MTRTSIGTMLSAGVGATPPTVAVTSLITNLQSEDAELRTKAWQTAGAAGAAAVAPLVEVFDHDDMEVRRAAKRALWQIVRHAGRPAAIHVQVSPVRTTAAGKTTARVSNPALERGAVAGNLIALLGMDHPTWVKREVLWMLSEIGDDFSVPAVAGFLTDDYLRDDARMALERIPGDASRAALEQALASAPKEFQPAIAVSLRKLGVGVKGYPSVSKVPTRQTEVKPI